MPFLFARDPSTSLFMRTRFGLRSAVGLNVKPPPILPVIPALVAPEWRWFWDKVYLSFPLYDSSTMELSRNKKFSTTGLDEGANRTGRILIQDAATDRINVGSIDNITDPITVFAYGDIITAGGGGINSIICGFFNWLTPFQGWGFGCSVHADDMLDFWDGTAWRSETTTVVAGTGSPHLMAATHDGINVGFYIDGKPGSVVAAASIPAWTGFKRVFSRADAVRGVDSAEWSYVHIVNKAVSPGEHLQLSRDPFGPFRINESLLTAAIAETDLGLISQGLHPISSGIATGGSGTLGLPQGLHHISEGIVS